MTPTWALTHVGTFGKALRQKELKAPFNRVPPSQFSGSSVAAYQASEKNTKRGSIGVRSSDVLRATRTLVCDTLLQASSATKPFPTNVAPNTCHACRTGWGPLSEVLLNLPGGHFDVLQTLDSRGMPTETAFRSSSSFPQPTSPSLATPSNMAQQGHSGMSTPRSSTASLDGLDHSRVGGQRGGTGTGPTKPPPETVLVVFIGERWCCFI